MRCTTTSAVRPPVSTGAIALVILAALAMAASGRAGRGSIRGASAPMASAPSVSRPATGTASAAGRGSGYAGGGAAQVQRSVPSSAGAAAAARTGQAYGARGAYGSSAAARVQAGTAGGAVVAGRAYRGPVWATTLPAGARGANYFGRPYYNYGGYYYRPYVWGGVPYYSYVWPPYYSYYEEPPVGAVTVQSNDSSLLYADGSYYEPTYQEGETQYQVVPAPVGVSLPESSPPVDAANVTVGGTTYALYGNAFYQHVSGPGGESWVVVAEPPGVVKVKDLPADFAPMPLGNLTYFRAAGRYYVTYLDPHGAELYLAVDPPGTASPAGTAAAVSAVAPAKVVTLMVRDGTAMTVSMVSEIDSSRARPGDSFEGTLVEDLVSEGRLVAAKGSRAYGKVVASSAGPTASLLSLKLTELTVGGRVVSSSTDVVRYGTGASLAPKPGKAAQLQANLGAAMEGGQGGTTASAPAVERVVLAAGTPVQFRLASTLIVGVTAD